MIRALIFSGVLFALTPALCLADLITIKIAYIGRAEKAATISLVDIPPTNDGLAGVRLAVRDNNTTGKFLNQNFVLEDAQVKVGADLTPIMSEFADRGFVFFIVDLPADSLLKVADRARERGLVVFNAGAIDDRLREEDCRANVVHTAPTRSMLADGLAQYLVVKRWLRWLLVVGSHDVDKLFGEALRRSAVRFGAKIVQQRTFEDMGGARRTDSGLVQIQRQMPVFTQSAPEYDVLVAADESDVFASYLPYRTRDPRPVAGSAGLIPKSWDAAHDQWGANQLQNRFMQMFSRRMTALDMQAWSAARAIGEAAAQTASGDVSTIFSYIKGPEFALAAFKGQKLTLRDWNLQLRQPILLADGRTIVSVSPQDGFLHQHSELDTLGFDRPETKCRFNKE